MCVYSHSFILEEGCGGPEGATKGRNGNHGHVGPLSGLWVLCLYCAARSSFSQASERDLESVRESTAKSSEVQMLGNSPACPGLRVVLSQQHFLYLTFASPNCVLSVT